MPKISIELDEDILKKLEKRADKNYMSLKEMIEDIIRRSMVSYRGGGTTRFKCDDKLVGMFSREKRGRKKKKKVKKKK